MFLPKVCYKLKYSVMRLKHILISCDSLMQHLNNIIKKLQIRAPP
jgi:hypothetical protein